MIIIATTTMSRAMVASKLELICPPAIVWATPRNKPPANVPGSDTKPPSTAAMKPLRMRPWALPSSSTVELVCKVMAAAATMVPIPQAIRDTRPALIPRRRAVVPSSAMARMRTPHLERKNAARLRAMTMPIDMETT